MIDRGEGPEAADEVAHANGYGFAASLERPVQRNQGIALVLGGPPQKRHESIFEARCDGVGRHVGQNTRNLLFDGSSGARTCWIRANDADTPTVRTRIHYSWFIQQSG